MGEDWRYDPAAGIIFTQQRQPSRPYTERFLLPDPPATQLRSNQPAPEVDPAYLDTSGITPTSRTWHGGSRRTRRPSSTRRWR